MFSLPSSCTHFLLHPRGGKAAVLAVLEIFLLLLTALLQSRGRGEVPRPEQSELICSILWFSWSFPLFTVSFLHFSIQTPSERKIIFCLLIHFIFQLLQQLAVEVERRGADMFHVAMLSFSRSGITSNHMLNDKKRHAVLFSLFGDHRSEIKCEQAECL